MTRRNLEKELAENEARQRNKRMRGNQVRNDRESLAVDQKSNRSRKTSSAWRAKCWR